MKRSRQSIVDELDELGITFDENAPYIEISRLLANKKSELKVEEYKQGDNAFVKEVTANVPDIDDSPIERELPNGLVEVEASSEEVAKLQASGKLIGYREEDNGLKNAQRIVLKRFAIIRKRKD